jgi:hypothetical protein
LEEAAADRGEVGAADLARFVVLGRVIGERKLVDLLERILRVGGIVPPDGEYHLGGDLRLMAPDFSLRDDRGGAEIQDNVVRRGSVREPYAVVDILKLYLYQF